MHLQRRLLLAVLGAQILVAHHFVCATGSERLSADRAEQAPSGTVPVLLERKEPTLPVLLPARPRGDLIFLIETEVAADGVVVSAVPIGCLAPAVLGEARTAANAVKAWRFRPTGGGEETILVGVNWARPADRETVDGPVPTRSHERPPRAVLDPPAVHPGTFAPAPDRASVRAELTIDEAGIPIDAVPLEPASPLTGAALDAALRWRFTPMLVNGTPTTAIITIELMFALK